MPGTRFAEIRHMRIAVTIVVSFFLLACGDGSPNCDGGIDDGHVCPDDTVRNTVPFDGGVYLQGESRCSGDALQRFWPPPSQTPLGGFDCDANHFAFRPSDGHVFYQATYYQPIAGIRKAGGVSTDPVVPTPPCNEAVGRQFGFDAAGTLHYQCADTVRRGNGELVAQPIAQLAGVLADGRIVATRAANRTGALAYVVLDPGGQVLGTLDPHDDFAGRLDAVPESVVVAGDGATVFFRRTMGDGRREIVVYRFDMSSGWQLVRRLAVAAFGLWQLALPDGTVFVRQLNPRTGGDQQIVVYRPDGRSSVVWSEGNPYSSSNLGASHAVQLLAGPR
jgi:hypothetical protein